MAKILLVEDDEFIARMVSMRLELLGHEATRALRDGGYTGLIVAVTASVMSMDSEKAIKSGCDDCIPKPIGEDFEERITVLLK